MKDSLENKSVKFLHRPPVRRRTSHGLRIIAGNTTIHSSPGLERQNNIDEDPPSLAQGLDFAVRPHRDFRCTGPRAAHSNDIKNQTRDANCADSPCDASTTRTCLLFPGWSCTRETLDRRRTNAAVEAIALPFHPQSLDSVDNFFLLCEMVVKSVNKCRVPVDSSLRFLPVEFADDDLYPPLSLRYFDKISLPSTRAGVVNTKTGQTVQPSPPAVFRRIRCHC